MVSYLSSALDRADHGRQVHGQGEASQGWRTFISNNGEGIVALDLFVVPTLSFRLLFGMLVLRHDRREILWLGVTAHPTAEWIAHWKEMIDDSSQRIGRPRQLYTGATERIYVPMEARS